MIVLALSQDQMQSLCTKQNYGARCSPAGVCYGIDRLNYTLLTKIQFTPGEPDSFSDIENKLFKAYLENSIQTIHGFNCAQDFSDQMQEQWSCKNNPLRKAIENIHMSQEPLAILQAASMARAIQFPNIQAALAAEAHMFEQFILSGIPLHVALVTAHSAHAVTIVGFKLNLLTDDTVTQFYVLDSNSPNQLKLINLKKNYWYYRSWYSKERDESHVAIVWNTPSLQEISLDRTIFQAHLLFLPNTSVF